MEKLKLLKWEIKDLFSGSKVWTLSEKISHVSEYYAYLADSLDHKRVSIDADPELIQRFESVFLWLRDRLLVYQDSFRQQVLKIEEKQSLCDLFTTLSVLPPEDLVSLRPKSLVASVFNVIAFWRSPQPDVLAPLTGFRVFETKRALIRLSHILELVAAEDVDYDNSFRDFKDYFDPDLIEKAKLLTLVNYLNVQAKAISDEMVRALLTEKLADLEDKIRNPRVRWSSVILGFFALCCFLANLKTLDPTIYDGPLKTAQKIISVIHEESLVGIKKPHLLSEGDPLENEEEKEDLEIPDAPD